MTNRLRSLASRVITSWARPSRSAPDPPARGSVDKRHHRNRQRGEPAPRARQALRPVRRRLARASWLRAQRRVRLACALAACHASRIGSAIEPFRLEQPDGRRQVLLALANPAAPAKRVQQDLVHALIERRELQPLLQISERLVVRERSARCSSTATWQPRKRRRCGDEPAVELRTAVDLQSVEKVAREQRNSARSRSERNVSDALPASLARSRSRRRSSPPGRARWRRPRSEPDAGRARRGRPGSCSGTTAARRADRLGTSHSSSHSLLRVTACGASAR